MGGSSPNAATVTPHDRRRYDIDLLRIVSAIAVVVLHAGGELLRASRVDAASPAPYWVGISADTLGRFAVPAFFAMAGWVLLFGSPPHDAKVLLRRVWRIVVPLAVWTVIYLVWPYRSGSDPLAVKVVVQSVFESVRPAYHLWYLYAYVPCVLLIGTVVLLFKRETAWIPLLILAGMAALPTSLEFAGIITGLNAPSSGWRVAFYQLVYAVAGAALIALPPLRHRWWLWLLALSGLAGTLVWQHQVHHPIPYETAPVAILSAGAVLLVMGTQVPLHRRAVVAKLSNATFGVYLVHLLPLQALSGLLVRPGLGWAESIGVLALLVTGTVVGSFALSLAWGRAPALRRLLG